MRTTCVGAIYRRVFNQLAEILFILCSAAVSDPIYVALGFCQHHLHVGLVESNYALCFFSALMLLVQTLNTGEGLIVNGRGGIENVVGTQDNGSPKGNF